MAGFVQLQTMFNTALTQAATESGILLGRELTAEKGVLRRLDRQSYLAESDEPCIIVEVESREDYPGQFFIIFALRDAIAISGSLLGIPPNRITEKRRLAIMESDDNDAFAEILNQVIGSFNSALQPLLPQKIHLKLFPPSKYVPQVDEVTAQQPVPDGEYLVFSSHLAMQGGELDDVRLLFPVPLALLLDPVGEEEPPAEVVEEQKAAEGNSGDATTAEGGEGEHAGGASQGGKLLVLADDEKERQGLKELLSSIGLEVITQPLHDDVRALVTSGTVRLILISLSQVDDRELSVAVKLRACSSQHPLPLVICADKWTRTDVLKALKYGARDIILKPVVADELASRLGRFLKAA
jgi:CheY-like chemotaxis protein/chemotaxis protein CheY-P-specific phosphatase CheC